MDSGINCSQDFTDGLSNDNYMMIPNFLMQDPTHLKYASSKFLLNSTISALKKSHGHISK